MIAEVFSNLNASTSCNEIRGGGLLGDTWLRLIPAWEVLSLLSLSGINEHPPANAIRPCDHELGSDVLSVAAAAQSCVIHWQKCLCVLFPGCGCRSKSVMVFFSPSPL